MADMAERDELIEKLANEDTSSSIPNLESTLAGFKAELETFEEQIRQPEPADPFVNEPECQQVIERIAELGCELTHARRAEPVQTSTTPKATPLGTLGHYQLLAKLGEGGMGAVYRAVHSRLEKTVAIKVLPANRLTDAQAVARFQREMKAVGKLQHPNIVAAHDAGEIEGTHYLVMELVEGVDLANLVNRLGRLPINSACELIRQAALGLQHAYEHNLVHRDIKPSNLMLAVPTSSKGSPTVKILDLGLALLEGNQIDAKELTSTGQVMGTVDYMAPEQASDTHSVDIRADIYSLGATLYKLVTGVSSLSDPHHTTIMNRLMALATKAPAPVDSYRVDCPAELVQLIARLLAKSPDDRPATPEELATLLEPFAKDADLRGLLASYGEIHALVAKGEQSTIGTLLTADVPTFLISTPSKLASPTLPPDPPRRRWAILATFSAAAFTMLAALIIVVTSRCEIEIDAPDEMLAGQVKVNVLQDKQEFKDGWILKPGKDNVLTVSSGEVQVTLPGENNEYEWDGPDTLKVTRGNRVIFKLRRRSSNEKVDGAVSVVGNPMPITEPPPLGEWLKGRTILTVAQDGSGKFKTIQEALNALQPGQVVKVLDQGPYRERLVVDEPPHDVGLFSEVQTKIEVPKFVNTGEGIDYGHKFQQVDRFRIHGFDFLMPEVNPGRNAGSLKFSHSHGVVFENCAVRRRGDGHFTIFALLRGEPNVPNVIRECYFDSIVQTYSFGDPGSVVVLRNYFAHSLEVEGEFKLGAVRHNIFASTDHKSCGIGVVRADWFDFTNNTMFSSPDAITVDTKWAQYCYERSVLIGQGVVDANPVVKQGHAPIGSGAIYNNLHQRPQLLNVTGGGEREPWSWQIGYNCYPGDGTITAENAMPRATNTIATPIFYSIQPQNADFARLKPDSPGTTTGAGGRWPAFAGALPPGPAPREGDWFTRLQQRWLAPRVEPTNATPPITITEPPPLQEWLKGRTILTVAQDGSGQFKSIQEALNALQAGQVVKVLDKGPYRERLEVKEPPPDTGLVSEVQTTIERPKYGDEGPSIANGHNFTFADRFRIHGFEFLIPEVKEGKHAASLNFSHPRGVVLENCAVRCRGTGTYTIFGLIRGEPDLPNVIRECYLENTLHLYSFGDGGSAIVLRNYLAGDIAIAGELKLGAIRHNIFGPNSNHALLSTVVRADWFDFTNNTILTSLDALLMDTKRAQYEYEQHALWDKGVANANPAVEQGHAPIGSGAIYNNLHQRTRLLNVMGGGEREPWSWQIGYNCYPGDGTIAAESAMSRATNTIATPLFYSILPQDPGFARLKPDSPGATTGAGVHWPSYAGALPPGPAPREGDWFTRLHERWIVPKEKPEHSTKIEPPIAITEPVPLEVWLNGRTIITVAQDGSGQFKTIQSAIDALKPGHVIEVLDEGPYRESLALNAADDTGLISRHNSVIELYGPNPGIPKDDPHQGHLLMFSGRFRLSGIHFVANLDEKKHGGMAHTILMGLRDNTVIENCWFQGGLPKVAGVIAFFHNDAVINSECFVRDSLFDTNLVLKIGPAGVHSRSIAVRNWLRGTISPDNLHFQGTGGTGIARFNVVTGSDDSQIHLEKTDRDSVIEISNNTVLNQSVTHHVVAGATLRNNYFGRPITFEGEPKLESWHASNNRYAIPPKRGNELPPQPSDLLGNVDFLSQDPADRNYLRLAADAPDARSGASGEWPQYLGALAPGPAPQGGDWFTKLRERWSMMAEESTAADSPLAIKEPPPLDEWLKGRTILTVAQDGSGHFKTIQSALDALKPGQVIEIMDRGPYREVLGSFAADDSGIISRNRTVIERHGFHQDVPESDPHHGHTLHPVGRFRLHGLDFVADLNQREHAGMGHATLIGIMDDTVIENCRFQGGLPNVFGIVVSWREFALPNAECFVRDCVFDTSAGMNITGLKIRPRLVAVRNWFRTVPQDSAQFHIDGPGGTAIVRYNTFGSRSNHPLKLRQTGGPGTIEVSNNTILTGKVWVLDNAKLSNVTFKNNIFDLPIRFDVQSSELTLAKVYDSWHVRNNRYMIPPVRGMDFAKQKTDLIGEATFLSKDSTSADYLHIGADSQDATAGAGGKWPTYIGAFPPGSPSTDGDWLTRLQKLWPTE